MANQIIDRTDLALVSDSLKIDHCSRCPLDVQRVPVGKVVDEPPVIRTEGDVTVIPVLKETMIVEKRLVLVEEVHIRRNTSSRQVEMPVALRKQKAIIESAPTDKPARPEERS